MEDLDDVDDDDQPRVAYVDTEREGRLARYAAPDADASRGSHGAGPFAGGEAPPAPGGGALWATMVDDDAALPPASPDLASPRSSDVSEDASERARDPAADRAEQRNARREPIGDAETARGARRAEDAERDFLEETLGNAAAAARLAADAAGGRGGRKPPASAAPPRRSPRRAPAAAAAAAEKPAGRKPPPSKQPSAKPSANAFPRKRARGADRATERTNARAPSGGIKAAASDSLRRLAGVVDPSAEPSSVPRRNLPQPNLPQPQPRPEPRARLHPKPNPKRPKPNAAVVPEASNAPLPSDPASESEEDGIDDASDTDPADQSPQNQSPRNHSPRNQSPRGGDDVDLSAPVPDSADPERAAPPAAARGGGLMSAMALVPATEPEEDGSRGVGGGVGGGGGGGGASFAWPSSAAASRGAGARRRGAAGGANAPTARLARAMHRHKANLARFASECAAGPGSGDAGATRARAWGRPLEIVVSGEPGLECGLATWAFFVAGDDDSGPSNDNDDSGSIERGRGGGAVGSEVGSGGSADWLRRGRGGSGERGFGAAGEEAAAVVMDARRAREIGVVAGARVRVHPPWHEVDVAASARTGFRRRRVVIASMVSVAAK